MKNKLIVGVLLLVACGGVSDDAQAAPERVIFVCGGQSLGIGVLGGGNSVSSAQVGDNKMCASVRRDMVSLVWEVVSPASTLAPAIASNIPSCNPYPSVCLNNFAEPPVIGMANYYRNTSKKNAYVAVQARDASAYIPWMQVGQSPFNNLNLQVASFGSQAEPGYCGAFYIIHGEADHIAGTTAPTYEVYLLAWRQDVQALCDAVTPMRGRQVIAFIDQVSSFTDASMGSSSTSNIDVAQYSTAKVNRATHKLVGAKYIAPGGYGGPHGYATSYRYWGAMAGKAFHSYETTGVWEPVWPIAYARSSANVVITYNVPVPPLQLGTACNGGGITVTDPGNYGFSYSTSAISSVALCTGTDTPIAGCFAPTTCVSIGLPLAACERAGQTIAGVSYVLTTPGSGVAQYAHVGTPGAAPGQTTGVRGMLCDSDSAVDNGISLKNWGVQTGIASLDTVP